MAIHEEVLLRLNESSAATAAERMVAQMGMAGTKAGTAYSTAMAASMTTSMATVSTAASTHFAGAMEGAAAGMVGRMSSHGAAAATGFGSAFSTQLLRAAPMSGFTSMLAGYESKAGMAGAAAGRAMGTAFTVAAGGIFGAAGFTLFEGFKRYEAIDAARQRLTNLNKTLEESGKAGIDVQRVLQTVNDTVQGTPFALDKAFSVATRALASPTGDLKRFMTDLADITAFTQGSFEDIGQAMLNVANKGHVNRRELHNQLRGMPQEWLADTLKVSGAELDKMLRKNQVGFEDLLRTIEQHAPNAAKSAGDSVQGAIMNVKTAIARAGEGFLSAIFGKATDSNTMVTTLKTVQERLNEIGVWVSAHRGQIHDFFSNAAEVAGDLGGILLKILGFLADHKEAIYGVVIAFGAWKAIEGVASLITALETIGTLLGVSLPASAAAAGGAISTALASIALPAWLLALLPLLGGDSAQNAPQGPTNQLKAKSDALEGWQRANPGKPTGKDLNDRYSTWLRGQGPMPDELKPYFKDPANASGTPFFDAQGRPLKADGTPFGPTAPEGPNPNIPRSTGPGGPGPAGSPIVPPGGDGGKDKKPKLPKAPEVPYDTALPPGFDNLPMSSSLFGAENSYLDANHKLAEKRARLAQLEKDANATEQDVLKARNDVIEAQRDQQGAEMRLHEARQGIFDKQGKQFKSWIKELGDIGASLDADFGISKGLAGIAENVTKFIANLAAAPIIGKLAAGQMAAGYKPGEAGQGLMGMMAMQGAFGPQYQIPGSIAQEMAKGGGMPGMGGMGGGGGLNWDALAAKESSGNWQANTGNGYFGGLQFDQSTWNAYKPPGAPDNPAQATREQQIQAGMAGIQARGGPQSLWPKNWSQLGGGGGGAGGGGLGLTGGGLLGGILGGPNQRAMFGGAGYATAGSGGVAAPAGMSARDFAHNVMMPFWQARGITAGDHGADKYGEHQNGALDLMVPDLPTGQQVLQQVLSDPNVYGAIFNNQTYGYGHGLTPQDYSGGHTGDPSQDHTNHVHAWYKPGSPGNILPPGMGAGMPGLDGIMSGGGGGLGVQSAGFGQGGGVGSGLGGGGGADDVHGFGGRGPGPGMPGLPGTTNPTRIGGVAPPQGKGSGFGGIGGLPMAAASAAIGAMTMGAGAAASQSMIQLINRTIGFGGQLAGIGMQGLMETFLPSGSDLANNNWLTKIAGGVAGAGLMLPNIAGQGDDGQPTAEGVLGQGGPLGLGNGPGQQDVKTADNKNVTNNYNTTINGAGIQNENSMGNTVTMHQQAMANT